MGRVQALGARAQGGGDEQDGIASGASHVWVQHRAPTRETPSVGENFKLCGSDTFHKVLHESE
jgi:hypothetical protein